MIKIIPHNALFMNFQAYPVDESKLWFWASNSGNFGQKIHCGWVGKYLLMMRTQLLITCNTIRYTHHILPLTTRTFVLRIHKLSIAAMVKNAIMLNTIRQCIILEFQTQSVNDSILFWMSISGNPSERLHCGNANFLPPGRFLDTQVQYRKCVCTYTHGSLKMNYQ